MQARMLAFWWTRTQHVNKNLPQSQTSKQPFFFFLFSNCIHSSHGRCEPQSHSSLRVSLWSCHLILCIQISEHLLLLLQCFVTLLVHGTAASFILTLETEHKTSALGKRRLTNSYKSKNSSIWVYCCNILVQIFCVKKHTDLHPVAFWIKFKFRCCFWT